MNKFLKHSIFILLLFFAEATFSNLHAQTILDSTGKKMDSFTKNNVVVDTSANIHSPHKASVRSAMLPGWGQIYNKSYWKLPVIYGALGTTGVIFVHNVKTYKELRFAFTARYEASLPTPATAPANYTGPYQDSTKFRMLKSVYQNPRLYLNQIKENRDAFRRNVDYSVLVFAIFWALNIVDASVDANLKSFDVSPDLGFRFKAGYSDMARTNGVGLVLYIK